MHGESWGQPPFFHIQKTTLYFQQSRLRVQLCLTLEDLLIFLQGITWMSCNLLGAQNISFFSVSSIINAWSNTPYIQWGFNDFATPIGICCCPFWFHLLVTSLILVHGLHHNMLVSFPVLPTVQFLIACFRHAKMEGRVSAHDSP